MSVTNNLQEILREQKHSISKLEEEIKFLSNTDLARENDALTHELEALKAEFTEKKLRLKETKDENEVLKSALHAQIYNEKIWILNQRAQKIELYFKSNHQDGVNRLLLFENTVKTRIDTMYATLQKNRVDAGDEIYARLDDLSILLQEKVAQAKAEYAKMNGAFSENEKAELENLKNEQITQEQIKEGAKKNNIEIFIGQNLINKIGIFLIIIGVIAAAQFSYFRLPDLLKGVMMFALGGVMLIGGEMLSRKKANIFSLGITAGGVAVLYVAISISYFGLEILSMYPALAICVLVTSVAFLLSQRYSSKTIAAFALIGGYLPILSIDSGLTMMYGAMVYFIILNAFALFVSFGKKWTVCSFIGLFLNIVGTIFITVNVMGEIYNIPFGMPNVILLGYIAVTFLVYTAIPILGTYKTTKQFKKSDIVLLAINTFVSAVILYIAFYSFDLEKYVGLLAILFAVTYLLLGKFVDEKFKNENNARALFYLTGLAFTILVIPFQFGKSWLSLGWLAEGVALTTYGIVKREKAFRRSGFVINALCVASFLLVDGLWQMEHLFAYKYLAITLGSLIVLGAYIYKNEQFGKFQAIYKYITIINLWNYTRYISFKAGDLMDRALSGLPILSNYLTNFIALVFTLLIAYSILRIKRIADLGTKIIAFVLYIIAVLWIILLNTTPVFISNNMQMPVVITVVGTGALILANLLAVFAVKDIIKCLVMDKKLSIQLYPLIVSAFFVLLLTQNLTVQYQLSFSNIAISIIYALTALLWIVFGFIKKYSLIRKFGLGLAIVSVIKLFVADLSYLTQGYKIIAYFVLGVSLVAISFVYQYFSKRLEIKGSVNSDDS